MLRFIRVLRLLRLFKGLWYLVEGSDRFRFMKRYVEPGPKQAVSLPNALNNGSLNACILYVIAMVEELLKSC